MGIYLTAPSYEGELKVSGVIAKVLGARDCPFGSMPAGEFLTRLSLAREGLLATSQWKQLVSSGTKDALDRAAAAGPLGFSSENANAQLWFENRKLESAQVLGEAAEASGHPVSWH